MNVSVDEIISQNSFEAVKNFVQGASQTYSFPELTQSKREELWNALHEIAASTNNAEVLINCFSAIRILSREKTNLTDLANEKWLQLIKNHSGLINDFTFDKEKEIIAVEALKCLCNIIFNSTGIAAICCENGVLENILLQMKNYKNNDISILIQYFHMKLLFLITALRSEIRNKIKNDYNGVIHLMDILEEILKKAAENCASTDSQISLNDEDVDLVCEILKVLFNLTLYYDDNDEKELMWCNQLVTTLRCYLLISTSNLEKTFMLKSNIINLLINMPGECYENLITPINENQTIYNKFLFENYNMTAIYEVLLFVKNRFTNEPTVSKQHEMLSPVISFLLKGANTQRPIRKYLRLQILPPLKDVHNRPEQGTTLRNHLCKLLTTPITQLRDLVADLLFVLCKKNVSRMIKYTGYGNAAGLLAKRGLLGGNRDSGEKDYSSASEESETEEYADFKHGINPVTGCYEAPHPSVMENMTEEQKEYEAMKLVELMDNLTRYGTIKPCRIGADGKPEPIQHVLQLQEGINRHQINDNSDSDS